MKKIDKKCLITAIISIGWAVGSFVYTLFAFLSGKAEAFDHGVFLPYLWIGIAALLNLSLILAAITGDFFNNAKWPRRFAILTIVLAACHLAFAAGGTLSIISGVIAALYLPIRKKSD